MDTRAVLGQDYRPRVLDAALADALGVAGAVVLEGPRACGKTMSALRAAASYVFLDDPVAEQLREVAPTVLLEGRRPRLLDEWQLAPELWNRVRRAVDAADGPGQFLLTGSALPADDVTRHSGAGRFLRIRQYTMGWWERGLARGTVSLVGLFDGERPSADLGHLEFGDVIDRLLVPGFPGMTLLPADRARTMAQAYLRELARVDVGRLASIGHEP